MRKGCDNGVGKFLSFNCGVLGRNKPLVQSWARTNYKASRNTSLYQMASLRRPSHRRINDSTPTSSSSSSPEPPIDDETDFFTTLKNDSQSSIGVPSIRDRSTSPDSRWSTPMDPIDRLPAEILIAILTKLSSPRDLLHCMLVSKTWSRNCVDLLWHRPLCTTWNSLVSVVNTLSKPDAYYPYSNLVKRLNLSSLSEHLNDGSLQPFIHCKRIERLTLTGCKKLTDHGIIAMVKGNRSLLALDITGLDSITDLALLTVAQHCVRLQGLNITDCSKVTDESLVQIARTCKYLKRVRNNVNAPYERQALTDNAIAQAE